MSNAINDLHRYFDWFFPIYLLVLCSCEVSPLYWIAVRMFYSGSLEENIDVEHIASMSLFSDFFSYVSSTVGSWSVHSIQPLKRLTSKKRVSESAAVQCISAEVQRNSSTQGTAEALAESVVKPTRRRSSQWKKSTHPLSEVAVHNKPSDCWIVVKNKVIFLKSSSSPRLYS